MNQENGTRRVGLQAADGLAAAEARRSASSRGGQRLAASRGRGWPRLIGLAAALCLASAGPAAELQGEPWARHVIDEQGRGADGTKLADINGDGWPDVVTGWEEDGTTRVYLNPGPRTAKGAWAKVVVGQTPSVEDAVFADLDGDGRLDVVSSAEGNAQKVFVHWGPRREQLLDAAAWRQEVFPVLAEKSRWMFAEPMQFDGKHGVDLVIGGKRGGKSNRSVLGWLEAPANPREVGAWRWHPLVEMGWTMTIQIQDMDTDGDADILFSDRMDQTRGVYWLENPGAARATGDWTRHTVGATNAREVMLLGTGDLDGDGLIDVAAPVALAATERQQPDRHSRIQVMRRLDRGGKNWVESSLPVPANTGNVKSVAIGDLDADGRADLVVSCENAAGGRVGVYWLRGDGTTGPAERAAFDIAGAPGIKFDLVRLLDLDGDGDPDVLTNEEQEGGRGLGVVWYENPGRAAVTGARN